MILSTALVRFFAIPIGIISALVVNLITSCKHKKRIKKEANNQEDVRKKKQGTKIREGR